MRFPFPQLLFIACFSILLMAIPARSQSNWETASAESRIQQNGTKRDSVNQTDKGKKAKSPTGAMLRSLAIPGWGQWYNEQYIKAVLVFAGQGFLTGLAIHYAGKISDAEPGSDERDFYIDQRNQTYWFVAGVVLLSMLDAYIDAQLYDFDAGPDLSLRIGSIDSKCCGNMNSMLGLSVRAGF